MKNNLFSFEKIKYKLLIFLIVFGPATITAVADNDAAGVATYAIAGARLGYPILFALLWITVLLAITQEMGIRVSLVTRKGLGDLIRENYGIRSAIFIFTCLFIANIGSVIVDMVAFKTTAQMLNLPATLLILIMIGFSALIVTKGDFKFTQRLMLIACLFYFVYVFSAVESNPNWNLALKNLIFPQGIKFSSSYWKDYIIIGLGVLGTTITPWGQFFISSFGLDKKLEIAKLKYVQLETYWGAFVTDFFSFFMIVATAATLFVHNIPLVSGEQAAMAIEPFAGKLASTLFAFGILNAGFMGVVIISLSTTYAFSEFFGFSGSLDDNFKQSKTFYILFFTQLFIAFIFTQIPSINLFKIAVASQILNSMALPPVFFYLIKIANDKRWMREYTNNNFQKWFAIIGTVIITVASIFTVVTSLFNI